jgi:ribosomal protein S18 acetylase RimI-like enzyme
MDKGWNLRPTVAADEDFLWQMLFYASHSNEEPGVHPNDIRSNPDLVGYIDGWAEAGFSGVVAESEGMPVGAAWVRMMGEADRANPVFIDNEIPELAVAVTPGWEGRGLGTEMIETLVESARGRFRGIVLSSRAENPAVRLYRRLGFEPLAEMTNRVGTVSVKMLISL